MHSSVLIVVLAILIYTFVFCEYIMYYIILHQCSWPVLSSDSETENTSNLSEDGQLKVAFIADTHLLGVRKGHWFDKLRREWQMYRSFQTIMEMQDPELVFILGDVFDEASFSPDEVYSTYVRRFKELFYVTKPRELFVVAGNHDVGFHYAMHPYLDYRFKKTMNASFLVTRKNNHFVLINSMALEKDGCDICRNTEQQIEMLTDSFRCANGTMKCSRNRKPLKYSRPIMLMHFPLYRKNDAHCTGRRAAPSHEKQIPFKEKWDCLSKEATDYVLRKLHPRVVFTGHTHHSCETFHEPDIFEYTVPSFNWRNKASSSFILAVFTPDTYVLKSCALPPEYYVFIFYTLAVIICITLLYRLRNIKRIESPSKIKYE